MAHKAVPGSPGVPERHAPTELLDDSEGLHISWTYDGIDRITVRVSGEIDIATIGQLRNTLDGAVGKGIRQLIVDLRDVTFLGSEGLDCLVRVSLGAEATGCHLYTIATQRTVTRPIEITGFAQQLRLRGDAAVPPPSMD